MKIAIASGKGGTGKTTVSVNLARTVCLSGIKTRYTDCDVEEPNGHLFLSPEITSSRQASVLVPEVNADKCTGCGRCARICQFSAIVCVAGKVLAFPRLCHACGGCSRVCPTGAIREMSRPIGWVETGRSDGMGFVQGRLQVGEAMSPPLIREVRAEAGSEEVEFIDAPPGTSCPVIAAMRGVDHVLLVTEPTPFGLHDLGLAVDMVRELGLPHSVVVNRAEQGNSSARDFCEQRGVRIAAEIPNERRIAEAYSRGELAVEALPELREVFEGLWREIGSHLGKDAVYPA